MSVEDACTSLVEALDARRTDIVKTLLDHLNKNDKTGASIKNVLNRSCTPSGTLLHYAVCNNHNDAIRALLLSGADPGARNDAGKSVLDMVDNSALSQLFADELLRAVAASEIERISSLLAAGVKNDVVDSIHTKNSALHWAASFGTEEVIKLLINNNFDVNVLNSDGCSPLHDAIQRKDAKIVKILLDAGADPSTVAINGKLKGKSPKDLAVKNEQLKHLFMSEDGDDQNVSLNGDQSDTDDKNGVAPYQTTIPSNGAETKLTTKSKDFKNEKMNMLWPRPKHLHEFEGEGVTLPPHLQLVVCHPGPGESRNNVHSLLDVWQVYRPDINNVGYSISIKSVASPAQSFSGPGDVEVGLCGNMSSDEYCLLVTRARTRVLSGGIPGLHHACQTLLQLLWIYKNEPVPQLQIRDKPSLRVRGVLVDLAAYGRLSTFDTFSGNVRTLSKLKMNQLHLFIRLTPQQEWQLPYLPNDLITLDRDCHDRMVSVFPVLDIIQPCTLAELTNYTSAFSAIVSCFSHRDRIHFGPCLSSVIMASAAHALSGSHDTRAVFSLLPGLVSMGRDVTIMMCSNSLTTYPSLLNDIPSNIAFIEYGFQAEYPFMDKIMSLSASGCDQLLCAGTSSWGCLVGRPGNMIDNIISAATAASATSSSGVVVASWAATPALAPVSSSLPGWTMGLGLTWNPDVSHEHVTKYLGDVLTRHVFYDEAGSSGSVLLELGKCEASVELPVHSSAKGNILQSSLLLSTIMRPDGVDLENTSPEQLGKIIQDIRRNLTRLQASREGGGGLGEGLIQEIALSGELLLLSARLTRGLHLSADRKVASLQPTFRTDLANKLLSLTEQYRAVWLSRYQPSGMQSSLLHLTSLLNLLLPDQQSGYLQKA